jgi:hypothetical protein
METNCGLNGNRADIDTQRIMHIDNVNDHEEKMNCRKEKRDK